MKFIKKLFYAICMLIVAGCVGMLVCALNPPLTKSLAETLKTVMEGSPSGVLFGIGSVSGQDDALQTGDGSGMGGSSGFPDGLAPGNVVYVVPSTGVTTLPSQVSGRNGYEPIKEEEQQIADNEVSALKGSLDKGDVGSELTFDAELYPYYAMLKPDLQAIYKQIYANALKCTVSFAPAVNVKVSELKTVFEAVYNDHPELFWLETGYSCKYMKNGDCLEISLQYYPITNKLEAAQTEFKTRAQAILNGAQGFGSQYEKEKYVHDALMSQVTYDENSGMNQSAYSAMVNGRSVCAGYARAFQYLMQQLGIPCYYCTGYSGQDHAWNIVKLSDGYYNVDATWDDTVPPTYDYFNKSDAAYAGTHIRQGLSVYLPACGGGAYENLERSAPPAVKLPDQTQEWQPEPMKPLVWGESGDGSKEPEALRKNGLTSADVLTSITDYYKDCLTKMKQAGAGNQQFVNVVDEIMWIVIEREYTEGSYWAGYVDEALKAIGKEEFAIQLQVEALGDGYYRLYHNIVSY